MNQNGTFASTLTGLQGDAQERAVGFLEAAARSADARDAANWTLAAKNSIEVALKVEQIVKTRNA